MPDHRPDNLPKLPPLVEGARLDKWLWAARIFKTRSLAIDACKNGRVTLSGSRVKASRAIKVGDVIEVRKPPVTYSFRVLRTIQQRVGAKLIPYILEDITPVEQYELLDLTRLNGFIDRAKGLGRPTKRDRRRLDEFTTPTYLETLDDEMPSAFSPFAFDLDDEDDE